MGSYTGTGATNLDELAAKLQMILAESVMFHFQRNDFQKWIKDTIGDGELAEKIEIIKEEQSEEDLRREILTITRDRMIALRKVNSKLNC